MIVVGGALGDGHGSDRDQGRPTDPVTYQAAIFSTMVTTAVATDNQANFFRIDTR